MKELNYPQKIEELLNYFKYSTKLAEALGVSRISILTYSPRLKARDSVFKAMVAGK